MAKEKKGEQLDLIEVGPENLKVIMDVTQEYKKVQKLRLDTLKKEVKLKDKIKGLVKAAELQPLKDGKIKFNSGGFTFCLTPRDELITIIESKKKKSKKSKSDMKKNVEAEEKHFEEEKKE